MSVKHEAVPLHWGMFPGALPDEVPEGVPLGRYEYSKPAATRTAARTTITVTLCRLPRFITGRMSPTRLQTLRRSRGGYFHPSLLRL